MIIKELLKACFMLSFCILSASSYAQNDSNKIASAIPKIEGSDSIAIIKAEKKDTSITTKKVDADSSKHNVAFSCGYSLGGSLIRNELAPDLAWKIGVIIEEIAGIYITGNTLYFFEKNVNKDYKMHINSFVGCLFTFDLNKINKSSNNEIFKEINSEIKWYGIEFSYLIDHNGGYFPSKTFKLSFPFQTKYLIVAPAFIQTNKNIFPNLSVYIDLK